MNSPALDAYLADVAPAWAPMITELDEAVMGAGVAFDTKVRYRMLTYAIGLDWHRWVCAIGVSGGKVNLRFLLGTSLTDPKRVLRGGTSTLMTWDIAPTDEIDADAVAAYVREAAAAHRRQRGEGA